MMILNRFLRGSMRMLIAGAALHGLSQLAAAQEIDAADFETTNLSRSKQISLVADEKAPPPPSENTPAAVPHQAPGIARVPGCTSTACANGACANGSCTARAGACGPNGCGPNGCGPHGCGCGCGPNGCRPGAACQRGANGSPMCPANGHGVAANGYSFRDAGRAIGGAGYATTRAIGQACRPMWGGRECDWNDELADGHGRWSGQGQWSGPCPEHGQHNCPHCCGWLHDQWDMFNCRNRQQGEIMRAHIHGKLAYFHPMGNGGEGVPPFGHYHLVYAANPNYSDPRDSQIYAAQGWGVPMSVPLAPTVRHTMNYSSGMPASRLTPISNVVPPRGGRGW